MSEKSKCCNAPIVSINGIEGTGYMECSNCHRPCDIAAAPELKIGFDQGSPDGDYSAGEGGGVTNIDNAYAMALQWNQTQQNKVLLDPSSIPTFLSYEHFLEFSKSKKQQRSKMTNHVDGACRKCAAPDKLTNNDRILDALKLEADKAVGEITDIVMKNYHRGKDYGYRVGYGAAMASKGEEIESARRQGKRDAILCARREIDGSPNPSYFTARKVLNRMIAEIDAGEGTS